MENSVCPVVLISVSDKSGIVSFAKSLSDVIGARLVSSAGTAAVFNQNGIETDTVEDWTGFPEILEGRVKTLHPVIHAGILADSNKKSHLQDLENRNISPISVVVVNLYPFEKVLLELSSSHDALIENIDIGGAALLRSAAKNYKNVLVIVDPSDYERALNQLSKDSGVDCSFRLEMAAKAFELVANYDHAISAYFSGYYGKNFSDNEAAFPFIFESHLLLCLKKRQDLRYGENAHQKSVLYVSSSSRECGIAHAPLLQGKSLSYNNLVDADTAWACVSSFDELACVIVKHANPCGLAIAETSLDAYRKALRCDELSSFGGIVAFNSEVDEETAVDILKVFVEVVIAPGFTSGAKQVFARKPNIRVLTPSDCGAQNECEFKHISGGGVLLQELDCRKISFEDCRVVSDRQPTKLQQRDLMFAWRAVKYVKSNAVIFCSNGMSLGIGAGQMSRVDAVDLAIFKAADRNLDLSNSVVASDAFFPFPDSIERIAKAGAVSIIQPGGSVRDQEVIDETNRHSLVMVFTGVRHFRH
ncbi:bifunctional phosphoribosylaminoimidazolecarboxamide formyltransferase/IMP cyclohydrolase [Candidatus Ichthyocystis hellenicum]|uniref:bifunctional phosphoribosylaminoimidazolecarboxamide formyltransferase/IMP cyclohydrolase n=1 Tax=Candidatus Ichthyocystis hellenicum TaxID=1561003 RepID=UPI000A8C96C7|nr:bifunctional phosphoribosylaminoimidazolecarboxamide formyltransferase/IMP cyclohydrolase [Candidatus Ichthyocystis hellenicum]